MTGRFLPGVPGSEIEAIFNTAAGNEIVTGKFDSPESSAALAANTFGFFLQRASDLPALPGCGSETWPSLSLMLEAEIRFPWSGGRHPVLDCLVRTPSALIGIESKRFEPYRTRHTSPLSDAYWRRVWGEHMSGYERVRDSLTSVSDLFGHLDAAQLFKHAFALRTEGAKRRNRRRAARLVWIPTRSRPPPELRPPVGGGTSATSPGVRRSELKTAKPTVITKPR